MREHFKDSEVIGQQDCEQVAEIILKYHGKTYAALVKETKKYSSSTIYAISGIYPWFTCLYFLVAIMESTLEYYYLLACGVAIRQMKIKLGRILLVAI